MVRYRAGIGIIGFGFTKLLPTQLPYPSLGALGDIVYVNFAYDGGVRVYSSYFVLLAAFLLVQDAPAIYRLFVREKFTVPVNWYPQLVLPRQKGLRIGLKSLAVFLFLGVLFYLQLVNIGEEADKINKLAASARRTREYAAAPRNEGRNRMILQYRTTGGSRVILTGTNEHKDSVRIVLDRYNPNYALSKSSLQAGKYD